MDSEPSSDSTSKDSHNAGRVADAMPKARAFLGTALS